jgi:hypothetical protein
VEFLKLSGIPDGEITVKQHVLSAAARAISKATKVRWAKFRAEKAKKGKP